MKTTVGWMAGSGLMASWLLPSLAWAHSGGDAGAGFGAGFAHPFLGLDHLLAMLAVGLWSVQLGSAMRWRLPLTFVGAMALGSVSWPVPLGGVEPGIAASVLILGAAVAFALRPHLLLAGLAVAFVAFVHGHAHGVEMPLAADPLAYGAGMLLATAMLHGAGVVGGGAVKSWMLRAAGITIGAAGAGLLLG